MRARGFTLIELLVVIAIIGLLSSIVLTSLNAARAKARDSQRKQDLTQLRIALENYYANSGRYPSEGWLDTSMGSNNDGTPLSGSDWSTTSGIYQALVPTYIKKLPVDPLNTWSGSYYYNYEPSSAAQGNCTAANYTCEYIIQARLESGQWFCVGSATANLGGC